MTTPIYKARPSRGEQLSQGISRGLEMGSQLVQQNAKKQQELDAYKQMGIDPAVANLPDNAKAEYFKNVFSQDKGLNPLQQEKLEALQRNKKLFEQLGFGMQGNNAQSQGDQLQRGGEQPQQGFKQPQGQTGQQQPQDMSNVPDETLNKIASFKGQPGEEGIFGNMAQAELDKRENNLKIGQQNRKETRESFHTNEPFITKVQDQYEDSLRRGAIFDRMDQLEQSGELSDSGMINLLETIGLQPEWLKNPANEEYNKLGLDLLGGGTLQADYGSRVLASEFKVSQQRIPTLSQTPEGRKQIKENIRTMLLPAELKNERMQYYLDKSERTGEPLPNDLRGKVLRDIKPQLEEAYDKFKQRNGRYKVKSGTYADDDVLDKYFFLANENEKKAVEMMGEDGYEID